MSVDTQLLSELDKRGPRYTSYPPAPYFTYDFGPESFTKALQASNAAPTRPLSLYIHVPFCHQLCYYCGCTKLVTRNREKIDAYLKTLYKEAELFARQLDPRRQVQQIHLGGGTPNSLDPEQLADLLSDIRGCFHVSSDAEIGIEIDPRVIELKDLDRYRLAGFNRISIGVQDFDPLVQKAINREQSRKHIAMLISEARFVGFRGINTDLIYGLPRQTLKTFGHTLDELIKMRPDRVAVYSYAHLPQQFKAQRLIKLEDLPDPEVKLELLELAVEKLTDAGYRHIGMDHFALPEDELARALTTGKLQRNFQGYSTRSGCDMIGLGMSAISSVGDDYAQNAKTLPIYTRHIEAGEFATVRGLHLTEEEGIRRDLIQRLMCSGKIDMDAFGRDHGINFEKFFERDLGRLKPYVNRGLVNWQDHTLEVTEIGRYLLRPLAMAFDPNVNQPGSQGEYSKVV